MAPTIVEGIAWQGCITVLVAESSAGKTFVALDLAAAVSAGLSWHGRAVTQGAVVHVGYEGDAIGLRLRALHEHRAATLEHVYSLHAGEPLSPLVTRDGELRSRGERDVVDALRVVAMARSADELPPIVLVIIDTVRASLAGSEDSSEAVSAYLRSIHRILDAIPTAACLVIHHAGWQDGEAAKKRERGSSAFRGNVDATIYLHAEPYNRETQSARLELVTHKVRDGEPPQSLYFIRQRVTFDEQDAHGKPITSCVIDPDPKSVADHAADKAAHEETIAHALDLRLLRGLIAHPDAATSQDKLALAIGMRKQLVVDALARTIPAGWVTLPKQRQPYTITPAGRAALALG